MAQDTESGVDAPKHQPYTKNNPNRKNKQHIQEGIVSSTYGLITVRSRQAPAGIVIQVYKRYPDDHQNHHPSWRVQILLEDGREVLFIGCEILKLFGAGHHFENMMLYNSNSLSCILRHIRPQIPARESADTITGSSLADAVRGNNSSLVHFSFETLRPIYCCSLLKAGFHHGFAKSYLYLRLLIAFRTNPGSYFVDDPSGPLPIENDQDRQEEQHDQDGAISSTYGLIPVRQIFDLTGHTPRFHNQHPRGWFGSKSVQEDERRSREGMVSSRYGLLIVGFHEDLAGFAIRVYKSNSGLYDPPCWWGEIRHEDDRQGNIDYEIRKFFGAGHHFESIKLYASNLYVDSVVEDALRKKTVKRLEIICGWCRVRDTYGCPLEELVFDLRYNDFFDDAKAGLVENAICRHDNIDRLEIKANGTETSSYLRFAEAVRRTRTLKHLRVQIPARGNAGAISWSPLAYAIRANDSLEHIVLATLKPEYCPVLEAAFHRGLNVSVHTIELKVTPNNTSAEVADATISLLQYQKMKDTTRLRLLGPCSELFPASMNDGYRRFLRSLGETSHRICVIVDDSFFGDDRTGSMVDFTSPFGILESMPHEHNLKYMRTIIPSRTMARENRLRILSGALKSFGNHAVRSANFPAALWPPVLQAGTELSYVKLYRDATDTHLSRYQAVTNSFSDEELRADILYNLVRNNLGTMGLA